MAVLRCMNPGNGETSYANNSGLQKAVILETLGVLDEALNEMFTTAASWKCLKVVDLGCSSGPNTIFLISHILDTVQHCFRVYHNNQLISPEIEVFLNDLPHNDFNNLFKLLPRANTKNTRPCFFYGLPGSFYSRLLPSNTIHFAYSSYSLHWLSQIPKGLERNNKENIYVAKTSPPEVLEAYAEQYRRDLSAFLSARGDEIIAGGRMVLTFVGRSVEDPSFKDDAAYLTLLSQALLDMVAEGIVKIDDLYSFNVPIYLPYIQEVEAVIQNEGSFSLDKMHVFRIRWDAHGGDDLLFNKFARGKLVAQSVRAFMEPMMATHFGSSIVDQVFERYAEKVEMHLSTEEGSYFSILISLRRNKL